MFFICLWGVNFVETSIPRSYLGDGRLGAGESTRQSRPQLSLNADGFYVGVGRAGRSLSPERCAGSDSAMVHVRDSCLLVISTNMYLWQSHVMDGVVATTPCAPPQTWRRPHHL